MLSENQVAFKEWAVVVQALLLSEQTVIFRKGGIQEDQGTFKVDHQEFFLFPTYTHQQIQKVRPKAGKWFEEIEENGPAQGWIRIEGYAVVEETCYITDPQVIEYLSGTHVWLLPTILERFHQDSPGIHLLFVRVYKCKPVNFPMEREYSGCRSWVTLKQPISTESAWPVLSGPDFEKKREEVLNLIKT